MNGRARVAANLRRLRAMRGMSQETLAFDAKVNRTHVSDLENERWAASVDVLDRLASALGVDIVAFFARPDAPGTNVPDR